MNEDDHEASRTSRSDSTHTEALNVLHTRSEHAVKDHAAVEASTVKEHLNEPDDFYDATTTQEDANLSYSPELSPAKSELPPLQIHDEGTTTEQLTNPNDEPLSPKSPTSKTLMQQITTSPTETKRSVSAPFSEWSHQQLATQGEAKAEEDHEDEWQAMPALATHRVYDDWGKVIAKSYDEVEDESYGYGDLGGAGKGYTKVHLDDDVASQTSFDDNTAYLFKDGYARNALDEDDEARDTISQMQTTKELLTEGQRIAYVGVVRLSMIRMLNALDTIEQTKGVKKLADFASESMRLWSQKMMVRVYSHMDIDSREQIMVEQLAEHGVLPEDLTPALMQNARVKNPKPHEQAEAETISAVQETEKEDSIQASESVQPNADDHEPDDSFQHHSQTEDDCKHMTNEGGHPDQSSQQEVKAENQRPDESHEQKLDASTISDHSTSTPPAYQQLNADGLHVERPEDLPDTKDIDLDIRWTVLCDLFLLLIADGTYDSRSRILLELVGKALAIEWQEICRFEKRVTDALEMQEQVGKETWDERENLEARKKADRKRRLVVMGLCTVGGGLVIGLSAGLLAPVIGAGLAAGFTSIGVAGTSSFFAGAGAATLIGTTGAGIGARVGINASDRRTGAVRTFEYRPLHNNKRVNLIVTVSGWMTGGVDDVRLPFSTVDPVMGDIYSVLWEPEMLQSTGETIQILATEALTQTIQQILGATALSALMAGLAAPIVLTKLAYLIDNPWTVSLARADAAGLILADSLIDRNLGARPITLVGFSLGARLIFSCLREMARRSALGIIQNVYIFGSPIVTRKDEWLKAKTVVSGRLVNGYAGHDWILSYLFRATSGGLRSIAGLSKVPVPGVENIDISQIVPGHMAYRGMMPTLLAEVGWEVESEEFTEIEDPDPDNHERRQRQLISDIEEARRQLEEKPEKKGFLSRFTRKKGTKKEWETYDEKVLKIDHEQDPETIVQEHSDVLFDVEAIRREALELAIQGEPMENIKEHLKIREIKTTLPPMRIDNSMLTLPSDSTNGGKESLRQTKSHDEPTRPFQYTDGSSHNLASSSCADTTDSAAQPPQPQASSSRPVLHSHITSPNLASASDPSLTSASTTKKKNPWDEEDEGFGQEKAIEMSFE